MCVCACGAVCVRAHVDGVEGPDTLALPFASLLLVLNALTPAPGTVQVLISSIISINIFHFWPISYFY